MTEWSKPDVLGMTLGEPATKFRALLGIGPAEPTRGTLSVFGTPREIFGLLGGGEIFSIEMATIEEGDTFLGIDLVGNPEKILKKIQKKGFKAFDDGAGIVVPELIVSMYVCEDQIQAVCWSLPVPKKDER